MISSKIKNLIHIGAHEGQEMYYYDQYNFEKIYFVEPIKECADIIEDKIKFNPRYEVFNCALGSEDKIEKFYVADGFDSGSSSLLAPRKSDITFSKTIDVEVKKFTSLNIENIDSAVIDTQGYEIEVLKGFNEKIYDLNIAIVEFANYEGYINQPKYKKLNKFMKEKGFVPIDQVKRINKPFPTTRGGSFGDVSTFSFYANKHITTGEGGMVLTNSKKIDVLLEESKSTKKKCTTIIKHVDFVESIWERIKKPFLYLFTTIDCFRLKANQRHSTFIGIADE